MKDQQEIQQQAEARERQHLIEKINELESILGIEHIDRSQETWTQLRWRVRVLKHQTGARINPNDPETQDQPILLGDFLSRKKSLWR